MKRTGLLLLIISIIFLMLTGCWNRRELSELGIAAALGIDYSEQGYLVSMQIVNPSELTDQGGGYDAPVTTYRAAGETIFEGFRKLTIQVPRKIYLGHLRMVIIGEEFAKQGIGKVLDILARDHELRPDFYLAVAKGVKAEQVLDVLTSLEKVPANKLFSSLEMSARNWAATGNIQLDQLISDVVSEGKQPVLTGIRIQGNPEAGQSFDNVQTTKPEARMEYSGMAVFKNDKLIGWLNEDESKGYNYIQGKVNSTTGHVPCSDEGLVTLEVIRTKASTKGKADQGKPQIDLEIKIEANVGEVECREIDLTKPQEIVDLEQKADKVIKQFIEQVIHKAQKEYKVDIFGFGEAIHRGAPKAWKELKHNWDQEFEELEVNIQVDLKIRRLGTIENSFLKEIKE